MRGVVRAFVLAVAVSSAVLTGVGVASADPVPVPVSELLAGPGICC
jgi:hypothetical protein